MGFANPWLLLGLLGAAVPVLIHLFGRRRPRVVPFPSVRLVQATQQRQRRLAKLRNLIILLLRVLAVTLVAFALAGPRVRSRPLAAAFGGPPEGLAVVRDDSYSMTASTDDQAPSGRAERALAALRRAPGGQGLRIVATSDPRGLAPPSAGGSSQTARPLAPAIEAAVEAVGAAGRPQVVVLTDMQAAAWRGAEALRALGPPGEWLTVVNCNGDAPENWAITDLSPAAWPVVVGMTTRLRVRVDRFGGAAPKRVAVSLRLGGNQLGAKTLTVAPGGSGYVDFAHTFRGTGRYGVTASLAYESAQAPSGPTADDRRFVVLNAGPPLRVLCVGAAERLRFVVTALRPPGAVSPVAPQVVSPADLAPARLGQANGVVLGDVPRLTDEALATIRRGPAGVLAFLGEFIDPAFYNAKLLPKLLPDARVTVGEPVAAEGVPYALTEVRTDRGPLAPFAEPRAGDLSRLRFRRCRQLEVTGSADILTRFDSGMPAIIAGRGDPVVILVNTTPDDRWTDAPHDAVFVPLVHRLVYSLAEGRRQKPLQATVGEPVRLPADVAAVGPPSGGAPISRAALEAYGVRAAGVYDRVTAGANGGGPLFAANVDTTESDLRRLTPKDLADVLGGGVRVIEAADTHALATLVGAPVANLSPVCLLLAAACLGAELWLSVRLRSQSPGQPDHGSV